jgi:hypothetical protein
MRGGAAYRNRTDDLFITSHPIPGPLTSVRVRNRRSAGVGGRWRTSADDDQLRPELRPRRDLQRTPDASAAAGKNALGRPR